MGKIDSRKLSEAALNERRRRAVKLRLEGISVRETARQCELATGTVVKAHQAYNRGGWAEVKVTRGHRPMGSGRLLSEAEESEVQRLIQDRTPDQLKMNYALWDDSFEGIVPAFFVRTAKIVPSAHRHR